MTRRGFLLALPVLAAIRPTRPVGEWLPVERRGVVTWLPETDPQVVAHFAYGEYVTHSWFPPSVAEGSAGVGPQ